jgi:NAD(P)-dependent dehydrogenase (short-subunit alcohol dehydrogenase family)
MAKVVIITGAGGELGKSTVKFFLNKGYTTIATVRPGKAGQLDEHKNLKVIQVDLSDESAVENFVSQVSKEYQQIDSAILLAGGFAMGNLENTNQDTLKEMFQINFESAYNVSRFVFQKMVAQKDGGRIVFIGSKPSLDAKASKGKLAYTLSKSLLNTLSDYINEEGASKNVLSYVVAPSTIDTKPNRDAMPNADFSKWVAPEEISELIEFIVSQPGNKLRDGVFKMYGQS